MRRRTAAALVAALACGLAAGPAAAAPDPQVLGAKRLSPRLEELTLRTPQLSAPTHVRVLLPAGYRSHPRRRYPVLYLLHGAGDDYRAWTRPEAGKGNAVELTARRNLIVVMPDGGEGGWYTDWFNNGAPGQPRWETWHVDRLIPFVDRRYRTLARRSSRAIAGLSMGGFGTFSYAARHPDLFTEAISFSGAVDTGVAPDFIDSGSPGSRWGPRATQEVRWRGHNPLDLAENLRGLALVLRTGNGERGGPLGSYTDVDVVEVGVHAMGDRLHGRLRSSASRTSGTTTARDSTCGRTGTAAWRRRCRRSWSASGAGRRRRARITFKAIEPRYAAWGWKVSIKRPALEFSELSGAWRGGFTLAGSGRATVTTPPPTRRAASTR